MKLPWLLSLALCLPAAAQIKAAKVGAWTPPFQAATSRQISRLQTLIDESPLLAGMRGGVRAVDNHARSMGAIAESLPDGFFARLDEAVQRTGGDAEIETLSRQLLEAQAAAAPRVKAALEARVREVAAAVERGEASASDLTLERVALNGFAVFGDSAERSLAAYRALSKAVAAGAAGAAAAKELAGRLRENGVAALGEAEGGVAVPAGPPAARPRAALSAPGAPAAEAAAAVRKLAAFAEGSARLAIIEDAAAALRQNVDALATDAALDEAAAPVAEALRRVRFSYGDAAYLRQVGGEERLMDAEQDLLQAAAALLVRYQGEDGALKLRAIMSDPAASAGTGATREITLAARAALSAQGMARREKRLRLAREAVPQGAGAAPYAGPQMLLVEPAPGASRPEEIEAFRLLDGRPLAAMPKSRDAKSPAEAVAFRAVASAKKSLVVLAAGGGVDEAVRRVAERNRVKVTARQVSWILPEGSFIALLDDEDVRGGGTVLYNRLQAKTIVRREDLGTRLMIRDLLRREATDAERALTMEILAGEFLGAGVGGAVGTALTAWLFGFGVASYALILSAAAFAAYLLFRQVPK